MKNLSSISIIGFGNQAKAWAMNLRDSGVNVHIGLRSDSSSISTVQEMGFSSFDFEKELLPSKIFVLLIPDSEHEKALCSLAKINSGNLCVYAHGYSLSSLQLQLKFNMFEHLLLAPKSIASEVRFLYETKGNISAIYSDEYTTSMNKAQIKELASLVGIKNIFFATFKEETQADLFSEQSILCSLLPYGALETFNTLRAKGYPQELAFFECFYEVKLIADTLLKVGPLNFFDLISPNALVGSQVGKEVLFDENFKFKLQKILEDITNGNFDNCLKNTNTESLREDIKSYWKTQELNTVYEKLKDQL